MTMKIPSQQGGVWIKSLARAAAFGLIAALACSCASIQPETMGLSASQAARVSDICESVLGLSRGVASSAACRESLSQSVMAQLHVKQLVEARQTCLAQGLKAGSVSLGECELTAGAAKLDPARYALPSDPLPPRPRRSSFMASNAEVHRREQSACLQIGYDPISQSFDQCVADLDAAISAADSPSS